LPSIFLLERYAHEEANGTTSFWEGSAKMRNVKSLILGISLMVTPSFADILSIEPSSLTVLPGEPFSVNVEVSGISDLYAFQFDIGFNPAIVSATSISEGSFLPGGGATIFIPGAIDNLDGAIAFTADTLTSAISGVSGGGVLATVDFNAVGGGFSTIGLSNIVLLDSMFDDIPASLANGSVNVVPEPSTLSFCALVSCVLVAISRRIGQGRVFPH
jgi:Cohesin domain